MNTLLAICLLAVPGSAPTSLPAGFESWRARLAGAPTAEVDALIREVDPSFDAAFWAEAPLAGIDVFPGQLDADAAPEVVVQVRRYRRDFIGAGERTEAYWIGVFDEGRLVGTLQRQVYHCNFDGAPTGLLLGFTGEGGDRALWIREQETSACGTLIDFRYTKQEYRLRAGKLEVRTVKAPLGTTYDRTHPSDE